MNMIRVQSVAKENNMNNVFDETLLPYQEIRFNWANNLIVDLKKFFSLQLQL